MTQQCHKLLHLPGHMQQHGVMPCFSMACYENLQYQLKKINTNGRADCETIMDGWYRQSFSRYRNCDALATQDDDNDDLDVLRRPMCQLNGSPGPVSLHNVAKNDTFREGRANGLRFNASKGNQIVFVLEGTNAQTTTFPAKIIELRRHVVLKEIAVIQRLSSTGANTIDMATDLLVVSTPHIMDIRMNVKLSRLVGKGLLVPLLDFDDVIGPKMLCVATTPLIPVSEGI